MRAANGIPAGIGENPAWSDGCAKHAAYSSRNAVIGHFEDPSKAGYTPEGDTAGRSSVLSSPVPWWPGTAGPWENAPIHLMQLLGPKLSVTGFAPGCMYTWPGYQRPAPAVPTLLSFPGDGRLGVWAEQTAYEDPNVPGDFVGLPRGTTTGPHLFVLAWGLRDGRITSASLTGPDGPVAIRTVDNKTAEIGDFMPPGGMLIPVRPLRKRTTYTASVTFKAPREPASEFEPEPTNSVTVSRTWSFQTEARDPEPTVDFGRRGVVRVFSRNKAPITISVISLPGGAVKFQGTRRPGAPVTRIRGRNFRICAQQTATTKWASFAFCRQPR